MALNLDFTGLAILISGVSAFVFLMLFPALLELKKPRDAGPRTIIKEMLFQTFAFRMHAIDDSQEYQQLDAVASDRLSEIISLLPNLES